MEIGMKERYNRKKCLVKEAANILTTKYGCQYDSATKSWTQPTRGNLQEAAIAFQLLGDLRQQVQDDFFEKTDRGHQKAIDDAYNGFERTNLNIMVQECVESGRRAMMQPGQGSSFSSGSSSSYSSVDVSSLPGVHIY